MNARAPTCDIPCTYRPQVQPKCSFSICSIYTLPEQEPHIYRMHEAPGAQFSGELAESCSKDWCIWRLLVSAASGCLRESCKRFCLFTSFPHPGVGLFRRPPQRGCSTSHGILGNGSGSCTMDSRSRTACLSSVQPSQKGVELTATI